MMEPPGGVLLGEEEAELVWCMPTSNEESSSNEDTSGDGGWVALNLTRSEAEGLNATLLGAVPCAEVWAALAGGGGGVGNASSADNSRVSEAAEEEEEDDMGVGAEVTWTVVYSLMIIVAIAGNAIVMWIVTGEDYTFLPSVVVFFSGHLMHIAEKSGDQPSAFQLFHLCRSRRNLTYDR